MLEVQNGQSSVPIKPGPTQVATLTSAALGRANMASGFYNGTILISGGFAAPGNPFPNNASLITLNADRTGIASTTSPAGYDGTSTKGSAIGNTLWIAQGHDGAYQNYLKKRTISTGAVTGSNSSGCPGNSSAGRINAVFCAYAADEIYYGNGYNPANGWFNDFWLYKPSTNTWTAKAPIANDGNVLWFSEAIKGPDGLIYGGYDYVARNVCRYNPVTNQWTRTSSIHKFAEGVGRPFAEAAMAVSGKYVLFFQRGLTVQIRDKLYCYRYDTTNDTYDALELKGLPSLTSPRASVELDKDRLYLYGGALQPEDVLSYDKSTKNNNLYIYELSKFAL